MSTISGPLQYPSAVPQQHRVGRQVGERCFRSGIAIVGLLIIRAIASALPMVRYADPIWHRSLASYSGTAALPPTLQDWLTAASQYLQQVAGASQFERGMLAGIYAKSGSVVADATLRGLMQLHLAIFPITVVRVAIDTVILLLLLRLGYEIGAVVRENFTRLPSLGDLLTLLVALLVVALGYGVYQGIFYPLLGPENISYYGWVLLAIGVIPLAGIIVNVSKNMDAITGAVFRSAQALAGALKCTGCGRPLAAGAKFCPYCGTVAEVPAVAPAIQRRYCAACGAENPPGSKFCKGCGQTL